MSQKKIPLRAEIDPKDKWAINDLYQTDAEWEKELQLLNEKADQFKELQGTMNKSASCLLTVLQKQNELDFLTERVYVYASQKNHEDMGNAVYQGLVGKAEAALVRVSDTQAFVEPELLKMSMEDINGFLAEEPKLEVYRHYIEERFREKEHILSEEMEAVLAKVAEIGNTPRTVFQMFNNADIKFKEVHDPDGQPMALSHGRYMSQMEHPNRQIRKETFEAYYKAYEDHKNTLAAIFQGNVQKTLFFAKMRHYESSRAAALDRSRIPESVYDNLITAVHDHMQSMYEYVALRKQVLKLDELHMYDVYVPLVNKSEQKYTFEEAKQIVLDGLAPLGKEYLGILQEGFDNGWIDVYENQGKRSGAYSWGAYGTHPYVLMNFNGSLNHVFTLAHEMGHAIHSYYSDRSQPYPYAGYRIFVAEVASTCNEALLIQYMMKHAKDKTEKKYLINYFLDQFRATLYRQTMFAEFEKIVHEKVQNGEALTAESLCEVYYGLNRLYFGENMCSDEQIAMEWSRIPHFYTPFYVYQYATGFSAAIAISRKILAGEEGIIEKYKQFLSGGSSMDCIDLLKLCDVDMTSPQPVEDALNVFDEYLKAMKEEINADL